MTPEQALAELQAALAQEKQEREQERLEYAEILRQADDRLCDCDTTMPAGSRCCWCMDTCDHAIRKDVERIKADRAALAQAEAELARIKAATWCAYCGKEYPLDGVTAEQIGEHIRTCEKHPMRQVEVNNQLIANERDWEIAKRKEAEADKAVLLEALEWYGNEEMHCYPTGKEMVEDGCYAVSPINADEGQRAREAIAKVKEEKA